MKLKRELFVHHFRNIFNQMKLGTRTSTKYSNVTFDNENNSIKWIGNKKYLDIVFIYSDDRGQWIPAISDIDYI